MPSQPKIYPNITCKTCGYPLKWIRHQGRDIIRCDHCLYSELIDEKDPRLKEKRKQKAGKGGLSRYDIIKRIK